MISALRVSTTGGAGGGGVVADQVARNA